MPEYATADEVARGRRPLTADQRLDVEALIAAAGKWIRDRRTDCGKPAIPVDDPTAKLVVLQVVRTALGTEEYAGHISYSRVVGGLSESGTLANPGEFLMFTDFHHQLLGIPTTAMPRATFGD
ncbi:hypothetical protein [Prescottella equi]|uniref:hypothetical protein n=1 Tax=Rhodococcus hoagii TaxID=43767 RepID=UPI0007CD6AB2|nr:hypothetical protein [Prescottella equi]